jgi:2'-5' RNA ligase
VGYAVELFFDTSADETLRRLFALTDSVMLRVHASPHISLAVFDDVDTSRLIDVVCSFAERTHEFNVRFSSVGIFPTGENVVFLAPVVTDELLALHRSFHGELDSVGLSCDEYYRPGRWVPHSTITMENELSRALEAVKLIREAKIVGEYPINQVHVVEYRPAVSLASFTLQKNNTTRGGGAELEDCGYS